MDKMNRSLPKRLTLQARYRRVEEVYREERETEIDRYHN